MPKNWKPPLPHHIAEEVRALHRFAVGTRSDIARDRYGWYLNELHKAGWPLRALGDATGVTGEAIRQRIRTARPMYDIPDVIAPPQKPARESTTWVKPQPSADETRRLKTLFGRATRVNGSTAADHPDRAASVELTELINKLVGREITCYRIAKILDVTPRAIAARLERHGFRPPMPSNTQQYKGTPAFPPATHGKRGHELSGPNLRVIQSGVAAGSRGCRACENQREAT